MQKQTEKERNIIELKNDTNLALVRGLEREIKHLKSRKYQPISRNKSPSPISVRSSNSQKVVKQNSFKKAIQATNKMILETRQQNDQRIKYLEEQNQSIQKRFAFI